MSNIFNNPIKIYALGGLGEVGKNTYCIESVNDLIILDAGVKFPEDDLVGVDYVIPNYQHLKDNQNTFDKVIYVGDYFNFKNLQYYITTTMQFSSYGHIKVYAGDSNIDSELTKFAYMNNIELEIYENFDEFFAELKNELLYDHEKAYNHLNEEYRNKKTITKTELEELNYSMDNEKCFNMFTQYNSLFISHSEELTNEVYNITNKIIDLKANDLFSNHEATYEELLLRKILEVHLVEDVSEYLVKEYDRLK